MPNDQFDWARDRVFENERAWEVEGLRGLNSAGVGGSLRLVLQREYGIAPYGGELVKPDYPDICFGLLVVG